MQQICSVLTFDLVFSVNSIVESLAKKMGKRQANFFGDELKDIIDEDYSHKGIYWIGKMESNDGNDKFNSLLPVVILCHCIKIYILTLLFFL